MRITEVPGGLPDRRVSGSGRGGPAVPRMVLGERLRRLREAQFLTRQDAADALRVPVRDITELELGRTAFRERDVLDLLGIYGLRDEREAGTLLALAAQSRVPGWWQAYHDVVPDWLLTYLGMEQAASVIRGYEVQFVPGLLQTPEYARAVVALGRPRAGEEELARRVEFRMRRQEVLHGERPPHLWAVIEESALRRPIGGAATMRGQLRHLIEMCRLPHVTVHVMPALVEGHAGAGGAVTLLRLPQPELPDVVFMEQLLSASYPEDVEEVEYYRHVIDRLVTEAAPATLTPSLLQEYLTAL